MKGLTGLADSDVKENRLGRGSRVPLGLPYAGASAYAPKAFWDWEEAKGDHCQEQFSPVKTTSKSVTFLFSFGTRPFIFLFYGKPREKAHCDLVKCFTVVAQFMFVNPCTNLDRPLLCVA